MQITLGFFFGIRKHYEKKDLTDCVAHGHLYGWA